MPKSVSFILYIYIFEYLRLLAYGHVTGYDGLIFFVTLLQLLHCYSRYSLVTRVTLVITQILFSFNPLFVEKVEQNHRKAKFAGSPLVVGKTDAVALLLREKVSVF